MENQVPSEKVMEFVTTDLITWFILHWIYYILSNFAKFLRNEKAVEVYLI